VISTSTRGSLGAGTSRPPQVPAPRPPPSFPPKRSFLRRTKANESDDGSGSFGSLLGERIPGGEGQLDVPCGSASCQRTTERSALACRDDRTNYFRARHVPTRLECRQVITTVTTRFTKGCVGERPAPAMGTKERSPANPQSKITPPHRRRKYETCPYQSKNQSPHPTDHTAPIRPLTATALSGTWHTRHATPPKSGRRG
jgi:hypothetical protein